MAGTRTTNTMSEGMIGLLQQLGTLKAAPDADLDAISNLESQVLQIIKQPQQDAMNKIAQAGGVVPGMPPGGPGAPPGQGGGMPPGMGPGGPGLMSPGGLPQGPMGGPPMGGPGPGGGGGLAALLGGGGGGPPPVNRPSGMRNGGALPPVDELRRLIASSGVA